MTKRHKKYSDELLTKLVCESSSIAEVLRKLRPNDHVSGGMHAHIRNRIVALGLDTHHFMTAASALKKFAFRTPKIDADAILVYHRTPGFKEKKYILKRALGEKGVQYKCSVPECGIIDWMDKPIKLHIEHKNGDPLDNRFENLCYLCPNCHSQTATYAVMNKNRR
jgi:hypothetical protein